MGAGIAGGIRELLRFLTRMATWISCVGGHVVLLVVVRTVLFPDEWPPIMSISGCAINLPCVDMQEMNPYFVVATLVGTFDSKSFVRDFECTVHANMPLSFGTRWQDETAHIGPLSWNPTWFPKAVGHVELASSCRQTPPQWCCRAAVRYLIDVAAAPLKSPATMSTCS